MSAPLHHFFHVYADGDWEVPVRDHIDALTRSGLASNLDTFCIGFVGSPDNVSNVKACLERMGISYNVCAEEEDGWEQRTLIPLWKFAQTNDGYVLYTHTKGAANYAPINNSWRRSMEFYNVLEWKKAVNLLDGGKSIVGCHWISGGPSSTPEWGTGGMFGGNFWWTKLPLLRENCSPGEESRFAAEHWLGQLSEKMPITPSTIGDLNPVPIVEGSLRSSW